MKKVFAGIVSIIMALSLGLTAFATETITEQNGNKQVDVQAKAVYISPENMYSAPVTNGNSDITTKNGVTISIDTGDQTLDENTLNVIEILSGDKEAYELVSGAINGIGEGLVAYNIFFTDEEGKRLETTAEITASITTPDDYTNPQVYLIGSDGTSKKVASTHIDGNTNFSISESGYYVLVNNVTTDPTDPTNPTDPESPDTGETNNMAMWIVLFFISGGAVTCLIINRKRKNADNR